MNEPHFILASQSPRRRELLGLLGYPFRVLVSGVDEDAHLDAGPATYVLRTAQHKSEAVARSFNAAAEPPGGLIIAADTTVALVDDILGKPVDAADARRMLLALRDREHDVHTAVCVLDLTSGRELSHVHTATVTMRAYDEAEIAAYIASGDPLDKAGAYGIQHASFQPVARLEGCFLGVMGLSLCEVLLVLHELGLPCRASLADLRALHQGHDCPVLNSLSSVLQCLT